MPKRVLICEDDNLLVDLLRYRLGANGYHVDVATDGAQAIKQISKVAPDAIVLDAMMPVMDGFEVLRRIRETEATANIPVIMLSARKQEQDIVTALRLGASDYVVKPFIPEELVVRLGRLIEDNR